MKITELPKATVVNEEDLAVVVQDGITKQVSCGFLAPREIRATLLFDKFTGVKVEGNFVLTTPVVSRTTNSLTNAYVQVQAKVLHSVNHTDSGVLTVVPVLSDMPTILYDSDASGNIQNRHFSDDETVSIRLCTTLDGEDFIIDDAMWEQICVDTGGVCSVSVGIEPSDVTKNILTYTINMNFSGNGAANTADELKTEIEDVLVTCNRLQICTNKHIVNDVESEVIYNA